MLDDYVMASVTGAGGHGKHDPATGHYQHLFIRGLTSREEAVEYRRALHRAASHLHKWKLADIGIMTEIRRAKGGYELEFAAVDKTMARQHVMAKYGTDPTAWPYHSRRKGAPQ